MSQPRPIPWREVVLVNGLLSGLLGVVAFVAVRRLGHRADAWVRNHPPEVVQEAAEVIVLAYLAYAVSLVLVALLLFFGPVWFGRRRDVPPTPSVGGAEAEPGAAPDTGRT